MFTTIVLLQFGSVSSALALHPTHDAGIFLNTSIASLRFQQFVVASLYNQVRQILPVPRSLPRGRSFPITEETAEPYKVSPAELEDFDLIKKLEGHKFGLSCVAFSPDGTRLASASTRGGSGCPVDTSQNLTVPSCPLATTER